MKSYDISVDSDTNAGGDLFNRVYYFDFNRLPKCKYALRWSFNTALIATLPTILADGPICVHMDSFTGAYQFQAAASSCPTHAVFGSLFPNLLSTAAGGVLTCDTQQSGTIILDSLPASPFFTVKIRYNMGTTPPAAFARYFMTLELTPLEDDYE